MSRFILLLFIIVPLIEIYGFITIGGFIGAGWTILLILTTAALGITIIRQQGLTSLRTAQQKMDRGEIPLSEMIHAVFLLIAAALLLTPGFFTDSIGFCLLVPPFRAGLMMIFFAKFVDYYSKRGKTHYKADDGIIDVTYRIDD